jgi:hypothetical protein
VRQGRPKILRFGALLIAGVLSYSESLSSNGICHRNWAGDLLAWAMPLISFARHQYPPAIIRHAVWLYLRFTSSYRDVSLRRS